MQPLSADVVIIGSGMGGGTTALALAQRGVDVLVLERGERLPREPENWSPRARVRRAAGQARHVPEDAVRQRLVPRRWHGFPLGEMQLIGKVQGVMMKSAAPRLVPLPVLNQLARRGVEWLIMAEDLPTPDSRVTVDGAGRITTARVARGESTHRLLLERAKRLLRSAGYDGGDEPGAHDRGPGASRSRRVRSRRLTAGAATRGRGAGRAKR